MTDVTIVASGYWLGIWKEAGGMVTLA